MAPTLATSPARVGPTVSATQTTAAFNAAAGTVLVACATVDTSGTTNSTVTVSNSGTALSWAEAARRGSNEAGARPGTVAVYVAVVPTARTGMTVTMTSSITGRSTTLKVYVLTDADTSTPIGATLEGSAAVGNNVLNTTALTTTANDSLVFVLANESEVGPGNPTSSNTTIDPYNASGSHSGASGYRSGGASGSSIGFNIDAAGTSTAISWNWVAVEIRANPVQTVEPATIAAPAAPPNPTLVGRQDILANPAPAPAAPPSPAVSQVVTLLVAAGPTPATPPNPALSSQATISPTTIPAPAMPTPQVSPGTVTLSVTAAPAPSTPPTPALTHIVRPTTIAAPTVTQTPTFQQAARPPLRIDFWALDDDGSILCPLPHPVSWDLSLEPGSVGAIKLEYPRDGLNFDVLHERVTRERDLYIKIRVNGKDSEALGALLFARDGDEVAESATVAFHGAFLTHRLTDMVLPYDLDTERGETFIPLGTAGDIMGQLMTLAQDLGYLHDLTWTFTDTVDSNGVPWTLQTSPRFPPGRDFLQIVQQLRDWGLCEFEVTTSLELRLYVPETVGVDHTVKDPPIVLRRGRDLQDAPRRLDASAVATDLLVAGGDNVYASATDPTAAARLGRRRAQYESQGNLTTYASALSYANLELSRRAYGIEELTYSLTFDQDELIPLRDLWPSDWVFADTGSGLSGRERIVQLTVSQRAGEDRYAGGVVLRDLVSDRDVVVARQLDALAGGQLVVGVSTALPDIDDGVDPPAPTGLSLLTEGYFDDQGNAAAQVTATWVEVTDPALLGYEVQWRYQPGQGRPSEYVTAGTTLASVHRWQGVIGGLVINVRVRAYDKFGRRSAFSDVATTTTVSDAAPPPVPSALTVTDLNGVLILGWDGLGQLGEPMPDDFAAARVHASTTNDFTVDLGPDSTTAVAEIRARPGATVYAGTYGTTYYFKLTTIDRTGNESAAGPQASGVPQRLVGDDLANGLIDAAKLAAGAVTGPAIAAEAVRTPHLSVAAFSDNEVPNGGFEDLDLVDPTKPANWTVTGTSVTVADLSLDTVAANVHSGSRSAKVTLLAGGARHLLLNSAWLPTKPGEIWFVEAVAKASRVHAGFTVTVDYASGAAPPTASVNDVRVLNAPFATAFTNYEYQSTAPATAGGAATRWVRFKVEARNTDSLALDVWFDEIRARKVVGSAEIANASIGSAQIALLAVQDANVANLSVGKLVSGTMTATITNSGLFQTNALANRGIKIDSDLRAWNSSGVQTFVLSGSTGVVDMLGKLTAGVSATSGDRVVVDPAFDPDGVQGPRPGIVFNPAGAAHGPSAIFSGTDYARPADLVMQSGRDQSGATYNRSQLELSSIGVELGVVDQNSSPVGGRLYLGIVNSFLGMASGPGGRVRATNAYADMYVVSSDVTRSQMYLDGGGGGITTYAAVGLQAREASRMTMNNTDIVLQVSNQASTPDRDGGFLWLGKGNGGLTYFGKRTSTRDKYIAFFENSTRILDNSGSGNNWYDLETTRHRFVINGNVVCDITPSGVFAQAFYGDNPSVGNRAAIKPNGGEPIMFYWSGGTLNIGVHSTGAFVKTFVIDHPTKPDRYLVHGATESPHAGIEYWGTVIVEDGHAEVQLPDYFEALARPDGRIVQVTVLAEDDPAERLRLPRRKPRTRDTASADQSKPGDPRQGATPPPGLPPPVQATYPRNGRFDIYSQGPVATFRAMWLVKAVRADVDPLDVEPPKSAVAVHGDGPYTYAIPRSM